MFPPLFTPSSANTETERQRESCLCFPDWDSLVPVSRSSESRHPAAGAEWRVVPGRSGDTGAVVTMCRVNIGPINQPSSFRLQLLSTLWADLGLGPCQVGYQAAEAAAKLALLHLAVCCARLGAGILEQFPPRDAEIEICWCKWLKVWDNVSLNNQEMGSKRVVKWRGRGLRCRPRILRLRCPSLRSIPGPGQIVAPLHADIVTPSSLFNKADLWKFIFEIFWYGKIFGAAYKGATAQCTHYTHCTTWNCMEPKSVLPRTIGHSNKVP